MRYFRYLAISALALLCGNIVSAEPLFFDSFESGDMSGTNEDGFNWAPNNKTSVVTAERVVWNNGPITSNFSGDRDWTPKHGQHSLRFAYQPNAEWTEQKFNLGGSYPEVWLKYWIRVPFNYEHGSTSPNNHKFFSIYMDAYSGKGNGATVFWNFWRDPDGGSSITVAWNEGGQQPSGGQTQSTKFINVPEDRGRWMEVLFQVKASSSDGLSDGEIRFWRRWESDLAFKKIHEVTNANLQVPVTGNASNGWHQGYLMGWANAPYHELTEWLIDDFTISETPLNGSGARPKAPALSIE
jgi:hypothetical protein